MERRHTGGHGAELFQSSELKSSLTLGLGVFVTRGCTRWIFISQLGDQDKQGLTATWIQLAQPRPFTQFGEFVAKMGGEQKKKKVPQIPDYIVRCGFSTDFS